MYCERSIPGGQKKKKKEKAKFESITLFRENAKKKTQHLLKVGKSQKVFPIWPHPQKKRNKLKT